MYRMPAVCICPVDAVGSDVDGQTVYMHRYGAMPQTGGDHRITGERFDYVLGRQIGRKVVVVTGTVEQRVTHTSAHDVRFTAETGEDLLRLFNCLGKAHRIAVLSIHMK